MRLWHRVFTGLAVASAAASLAPAALASSTPTLTLGQYNGKTAVGAGTSTPAGSTSNLDLDLAFTNGTGGTVSPDTPENLTINLPPGLLTNTSLKATNGSLCINDPASSAPNAGCEIGTGTVSASAEINVLLATIPVPVSVSVGYYLTAPPAGSTGDLAGLEVYDGTAPAVTAIPGVPLTVIPALGQIGKTGDILIRPTDAGATIKLTGIPDSTDSLPLAISSINSTFDNLRFPTTCPSTSQSVSIASSSYDGDNESAAKPLLVSGCTALPYSPKFAASATRDSADKGVALTTDITQTATQSPNSAVSLTFPTTMFGPNLLTVKNLCAKPPTGCNPVGTVTATSPLYPNPLSGQAYLSGTSSGPTLVLVLPSPFPLTLTGTVSLTTDSASFTGLPDIPLSDLKVVLRGGADSLFVATCGAPSGTATAALTGQSGQKATLSAPITYSGCGASTSPPGVSQPTTKPPKSSTGTGTGSGSGGGGGSGSSGAGASSGSGATTLAPTATARIIGKSIKGLASGKPSLTFKVAAGKKSAKLTRLTVTLPKGLSFRSHKHGKKHAVKGVKLSGAKARSATLSGKKLVLVLKKGTRRITVKLGAKALKESKALRAEAEKKKLKSMTLKVKARNAKGKSKALKAKITKLDLG